MPDFKVELILFFLKKNNIFLMYIKDIGELAEA